MLRDGVLRFLTVLVLLRPVVAFVRGDVVLRRTFLPLWLVVFFVRVGVVVVRRKPVPRSESPLFRVT